MHFNPARSVLLPGQKKKNPPFSFPLLPSPNPELHICFVIYQVQFHGKFNFSYVYCTSSVKSDHCFSNLSDQILSKEKAPPHLQSQFLISDKNFLDVSQTQVEMRPHRKLHAGSKKPKAKISFGTIFCILIVQIAAQLHHR